MARHGQRRDQDEQSRHGREQQRQGSRSQGEGQREFSGHDDWPSHESGFSGERGRRGNGHGEMEDFANRSGSPDREQDSWRGRGQSSGSGWGPEQEYGQGSYRGGRRSWEAEERGSYMDRQRDYRSAGQGGYGEGSHGSYGQREGWGSSDRDDYGRQYGRGGWGQGEYGGGTQGGQGQFGRGGQYGPYGASQYGSERYARGEYGQYGQGQYGRGTFDRGEFGDQWGQLSHGRGDYGGTYGQSGGVGQSPYGQQRPGRFGGGMSSGQYSGRGPKGYRRSDERIKEDVSEQLTQHPDIDPSEVEIRVQSGEVTLTGTVDNRQAKRLIEDLVEMASGVKEVNNQLRVKQRGEIGTGSDVAGASEAQGTKSRT